MPGAAPAIQYRRRPGRTRRADPKTGARAISQVFNGTSDVVHNASLPVTAKPYTLAAWVKPTNVNSTEQAVLSIGYDTGSAGCGAAVEIGSDNHWWVRLHNAGSYNMGGSPANNTWYHVALTVSSTGTYTLYVNGTSLGTTSGGSDPATGALSRGAAAHNSTGTSFYHYFKGEISEVGVWNVALTSAEVSTIAGTAVGYDKGYTVHQSGLKYYKNLSCDNGDYITWTADTQDGTSWNVYEPVPDAPFAPSRTTSNLPCSTAPLDWDANYTSSWVNYPDYNGTGLPSCTAPQPMYITGTDTHGGSCSFAKTKMPWIKGQGTWNCSATVGSCSPPFALFLSYNDSNQTFNLVIKNSNTGAQLESIASQAPNCSASPWSVAFIPSGTEFGSCGCDTVPHFLVTKT